ncbi:unnamed protein product [Bemisia tabaci]|uniref:alpha-glucosidase n=1 Tax=Bemisia tabaci TaxID=7038 RepID=A0A9N9ZZ05_BEMTA|nr:unnamed protein product [Bemisia tabaci]
MEKQDLESGKKLVPETGVANSKDIEVKFVPPDPRNGDAKVDIENLKCVFTGMGKEELMKYADDPFWVRLRWFLFILFWAIWIAMLVGAIGIIAYAPKCSSVTKSEWELSPIFKINVRTYGNGKLKDLESKLDYIKSLGVSNLVLSSVFKSTSKVEAADYVEDFESVDPSVGTPADFDALLKAAKDKGLKVQLALVPNHSSNKHPFFEKSVKREVSFADYYVWRPQNGTNSAGDPQPPNNQLSVNGGSAWTWNDARKEFYFHQFKADQPDFNFGYPGIVEYFKSVFGLWSAKGLSGFSLEKVQYLITDPGFSSDSSKITGTDLLTLKSPQLVNILQSWEKSVSNYSSVLTVDGLISKSGDTVTLVSRPPALNDVFTAANLHEVVNSYLSHSSWPVWQFSCTKSAKLEECWKPNVKNALQMVSILLPGTPIINAGDELSGGLIRPEHGLPVTVSDTTPPPAVSNGSPKLVEAGSTKQILQKLVEIRSLPAFAQGISEAKVLHDRLFAFTRIKRGSLSFLVAFNPTDETVFADFSEMKSIPSDLTVEVWSRLLSPFPIELTDTIRSNAAIIPPETALLVSFMPQV